MSGHVISEEHILELENIDTRYGRIPCLMNISLHVRQGEVLAILGANGAGKTTLLKTILGMIKPDKGIIRFENNDITSLGSHKRVEAGMAIVAAGVGSFPKMTVETNLRMGAYYAKNQKEVQQRLELGLAPIMVEETFEVIKHLKEEGMTIFLAEQNADKALEVSDYGYVIQKGQIVMEGNVEELRQSEYVENPVM